MRVRLRVSSGPYSSSVRSRGGASPIATLITTRSVGSARERVICVRVRMRVRVRVKVKGEE